jgi:hypothetical protein
LSESLTPEEGIPQGLKPLFCGANERAKPEGLAYLEAATEVQESPVSLEVAAETRESPMYLEAGAEVRGSPVSLEAAGVRESPVWLEVAAEIQEWAEAAAVDPGRLDVGALAAESLYPPPPKVPKVFKTKAQVRTFKTWSGA